MLDSQGRLVIGKELKERSNNFQFETILNVYFDTNDKKLLLTTQECETLYFIRTTKVDVKGRVFIPASIRNAFPNATYLPTEKDGNIYVIILNHCKEPE